MGISAALGSSALLPAGLGFRNKIINGGMTVAQRGGGSVSVGGGTFTIDRWGASMASSNASMAQSSTAPTGFAKSLQITIGTGAAPASGEYFNVYQVIEGNNVADLAYGTSGANQIAVSFWVRSSVTGTFGFSLLNSAQNRSYVASYTISAANTWEYKTVAINGDTTGTWLVDNGAGLRLCFDLGCGTTYSGAAGSWTGNQYIGLTGGVKLMSTTGATWNITGVQLERNYQPTPFEQRPIGVELALCQRYYCSIQFDIEMYALTSTSYLAWLPLPQPLRGSPSITPNMGGTNYTGGSLYWQSSYPNAVRLTATVSSNAYTRLNSSGSTISAEL